MIFGSFSSVTGYSSGIETERLQKLMHGSQLQCRKEAAGGFNGGYVQNPALPYDEGDYAFLDPSGDMLVLLSGSIYNREELIAEYNLQANLDEPVLIARMFLRDKAGFVNKLNGDFSIFICEPRNGKAWLFRDHVGIRPISYALQEKALFFSSDSTALSRALYYQEKISTDYLLKYFKYVDFSLAPNDKVKNLDPGHYLEYSGGEIELKKYWSPERIRTDKKLQYDQMLEDLDALVRDAVRIRCDRRFTAGAHVSGGLDSGVVAALAREEYQHQDKFYGFSWSPENINSAELKFDEREIVSSTCENAGIIPVFSSMDKVDFSRAFENLVNNIGFFEEEGVCRRAGELNTNLIFSGWGGDEFISITDRGIDTDLLAGMKLGAFFRRNPVSNPKMLARTLLFYILLPALGILPPGVKRSFREDAGYLKKPFRRSDRKAIKNFYFYRSRRGLHLNLLKLNHINQRTENWAVNGFRQGIEYRYPLLDKRIVEYMLMVPSVLLSHTENCRAVLREISAGLLPEETRRHWQKNDPAHAAWRDICMKESALSYLDDISKWENNPDLGFADFRLLERDAGAFRGNQEGGGFKPLFKTLVYLKGLHEFTEEYHSA